MLKRSGSGLSWRSKEAMRAPAPLAEYILYKPVLSPSGGKLDHMIIKIKGPKGFCKGLHRRLMHHSSINYHSLNGFIC